jgi:hypothetical protein
MNTPQLITEDQRRKDNEHIRLLSVFHFVVSGLALFGMAFLCLHYFMMSSIFSNPEMWKAKDGAGAPKEFFDVFVWFYLFMGVMFAVACIANILSGLFLRQRKHRMFSLVVAGLDCVQIPFGTALGVFTIVVLLRDSVRESYNSVETIPTMP